MFRLCLIPADPQPALASVPPSADHYQWRRETISVPQLNPFVTSLPAFSPSLSSSAVASSAAHRMPLQPSLCLLGVWRGGLVQGESLDGGRVAAPPDSRVKRLNMTGMKRGSPPQRHALSGILQRLAEQSRAHAHAHTYVEREECIIELVVCESLSNDEDNNTIRPIRTVPAL